MKYNCTAIIRSVKPVNNRKSGGKSVGQLLYVWVNQWNYQILQDIQIDISLKLAQVIQTFVASYWINAVLLLSSCHCLTSQKIWAWIYLADKEYVKAKRAILPDGGVIEAVRLWWGGWWGSWATCLKVRLVPAQGLEVERAPGQEVGTPAHCPGGGKLLVKNSSWGWPDTIWQPWTELDPYWP